LTHPQTAPYPYQSAKRPDVLSRRRSSALLPSNFR
jgi:hypothetical protein